MSAVKEFLGKYKAEIGLAVLVIYTLSLGVATADELFGLGLFPTKLDRMISAAIEKWESPDASAREQGMREIEEYGDFAVPQLTKALDREGTVKEMALQALPKVTGQNFGNDVVAWKKWYKEHKDEY